MEWQMILALVLAIPVLLIPVALIWYVNIGGITAALKEARGKRVISKTATAESPVRD